MRHGQTDESHRTAICCGDGCLYSRDKEQHGTHAVSVEAKVLGILLSEQQGIERFNHEQRQDEAQYRGG